jgi:hypothetical protein
VLLGADRERAQLGEQALELLAASRLGALDEGLGGDEPLQISLKHGLARGGQVAGERALGDAEPVLEALEAGLVAGEEGLHQRPADERVAAQRPGADGVELERVEGRERRLVVGGVAWPAWRGRRVLEGLPASPSTSFLKRRT